MKPTFETARANVIRAIDELESIGKLHFDCIGDRRAFEEDCAYEVFTPFASNRPSADYCTYGNAYIDLVFDIAMGFEYAVL